MSGTVIVGATSSIARAIAQQEAADGRDLVLAARDMQEAQRLADDLRVRHGIAAHALELDVERMNAAAFARSAAELLSGSQTRLVLCQGAMPEQSLAQEDAALLRRVSAVNYTSVMELCEAFVPALPASGAIACIASVAGDRGRPSNHVYGSAKAGAIAYLEGLAARLTPGGPTVTIVKPGFTDTAMTWGVSGMFLVASPERVARDTRRAMAKGKPEIYTPWFWRGIMLIIRSIPGPIFRRLSL